MPKVLILSSSNSETLTEKINLALNSLDGALVDIKFSTAREGSNVHYSALIIYNVY